MEQHSQTFNVSRTFNFAEVFKNNLFFDCTISTKDKKFNCHRVVLSGISTVFYKQLQDGKTTDIKLNYETDVVERLLKFIYDGEVVLTLNNLDDLLKVSYELEVQSLIDVINDFIQSVANPDTAILLLKKTGFAIDKFPRFAKLCARQIEKNAKYTDYSFLDPEKFTSLLRITHFTSPYVRDEIISKYCQSRNISLSDFDEFKDFVPESPDVVESENKYESVCVTAPPDEGLFAKLPKSIAVFASGNGRDPSTLILKSPSSHWFTESDGNAWVLFEFSGLSVQPTHYAVWSHSGSSTLKNWAFQASNDRMTWVVLSTHENDESLKEPNSTKVWKVETNGYFKYFRIIQTGFNWAGNRWLYLQKAEIWGNACSKED